MSNFHVGDVGLILEMTIMDGSAVANLSTATVKQFWLRKPDTTTAIVRTAEFTTNGTDGKLRYTWLANDLDVAGTWLVLAYAESLTWKLQSSVSSFEVIDSSDDHIVLANILTAAEAANVLRCLTTDALMLQLLPLVDDYIKTATGRDWTADTSINPIAKAAAQILLTMWYENPSMIGDGGALPGGLSACLTQLEAEACHYYTFEGLESSGYIELSEAREGDTVITLIGRVGASGDQASKFESIISKNGYIQQTSSEDLSEKWFTAYLKPPQEM